MEYVTSFIPLEAGDILEVAQKAKHEHLRFVQILAVNTESGIDLIYSYMEPFSEGAEKAELYNYKVSGVGKEDVIPSITDFFLEAFVFENEIHDLFGVNIEGIAIDFKGKFYALSQKEPMTIISKAQLEAYARLLGAELEHGAWYPGWEYADVSPLREAYAKCYHELFGKEIEITTIHAGLECGIIKERVPDMDIISCGPIVLDLHSPEESMDIASFERFFTIIKELLPIL